MNDWNCNNSVSSNDAYIGKSMGSATMSPYHSDICFPSSPANQFHKLANTTMYSCSNKYPEDCGSSACSSSITNTPELESQTFNDTVYGNIQNAIDPTIYSSGQTIYPQQQLLMPLLTQAETLDNSQKVLSHSLHQPSFQNIDTVGVSYALHPATSYYLSPIMSNAGTFEPPGRYATNYAPYVYYSNSTNHTSSNLRSTSSSSTPPPPYSYDHNYNMNFSNNSFVSNNIKYESQEENTAQNKCSPKINSTKISSTVFPCEVPDCNKTFSRPYNLKSHMRTHTLERPFACHYKPCAWKFARPHDLKRHELQHSGLKPHACSFCRRRFARSDALKRHWKVDTTCAQALREDITLNGGKVSSMANKRKKRSLQ